MLPGSAASASARVNTLDRPQRKHSSLRRCTLRRGDNFFDPRQRHCAAVVKILPMRGRQTRMQALPKRLSVAKVMYLLTHTIEDPPGTGRGDFCNERQHRKRFEYLRDGGDCTMAITERKCLDNSSFFITGSFEDRSACKETSVCLSVRMTSVDPRGTRKG